MSSPTKLDQQTARPQLPPRPTKSDPRNPPNQTHETHQIMTIITIVPHDHNHWITIAEPPRTNKGTGEREERSEGDEKREETEEKETLVRIKKCFLCLASCYSELLLITAHCS